MAAIEPIRIFRITGKETHGLVNLWEKLVDNRDNFMRRFPWLPVRAPVERGFTSSLLSVKFTRQVPISGLVHWVWHVVVVYTLSETKITTILKHCQADCHLWTAGTHFFPPAAKRPRPFSTFRIIARFAWQTVEACSEPAVVLAWSRRG